MYRQMTHVLKILTVQLQISSDMEVVMETRENLNEKDRKRNRSSGDIRSDSQRYNSSFITYELHPGIYTFKDTSEAFFNILQPEYQGPNNVIDIEYSDITMKAKLVVKSGIIAIRFDDKSFFSTDVGFTPGLDYKHYNKYTSQKFVNLASTNKIHLKCDVNDGSVVNGIRQPILYSFILDKPAGYN